MVGIIGLGSQEVELREGELLMVCTSGVETAHGANETDGRASIAPECALAASQMPRQLYSNGKGI